MWCVGNARGGRYIFAPFVISFLFANIKMLTVEEALSTILQQVSVADAEVRSLTDSLNYVLAEDLVTPHDSPPFDKSMMDGFAVNSMAFVGNDSVTLQVQETITAGNVPSLSVTDRSVSRIMTGAVIPDGADCVVPIEATEFDEQHPDKVTVRSSVVSGGRNILRQGVAARKDTPLMKAGTRLEPQHIAVLAEFGMAKVPVHRRSTVAVLATGDELLAIDQPLSPGRIRNSNEPMLVSQVRRANADPVALGVARDTREDLRKHIRDGLKSDFLLLSGGVSAGTLDLVPSELAAAGVEQVFHKLQMKPGKPLWFGELRSDDHRCWVFGLPGNPVSSMICFELFVRSALRKAGGQRDPLPEYHSAVLTEEVTVRGDRVTYFPARLHMANGSLLASPVPWGGSADLRSTADANGMCVLHPSDKPYVAGDTVPAAKW